MQAFSDAKNAIDLLATSNNKKSSPTNKKSGGSGEFLSMVMDAAANKTNKGAALSEKDVKEIVKSVAMQTQQQEQATAEAMSKISEEITNKLDDATKTELYENANFMQLLQVLEILNGNEKISKFPDFSSKIASFLSVPENVEELSNVKSINELLDLAKKFDLGLENIKITKEDVTKLGEMFKNLGKNDFFTPAMPANTINTELKKQVEHTIQKSKPEQAPKLNELLTQVTKVAEPTKTQVPTSEAQTAKISDELVKEAPKVATIDTLNEALKPTPKEGAKEQKVNLQSLLFPERQSSTEEQASEGAFEQTSDNSELNAMVRDIAKNAQSQIQGRLTSQTLSNFSQNLAEQIENYKSPFTRVNITLNPLNLGEVEVLMVNRGNNLHVNFNSTTATMNLFLQHQAEFKANMVNMGFTELQMNFSDQNQKQQEQDKRTYKNLDNSEFDGEDEQNVASLELVIPRYV
ncbi:flagellar hook-length control protein FliK [Campylobacter sp. 9BO]|uniref:flagellar hook-length control protein FliK n=1 Tax=Campylobacter sp. 9BO TaxID=3424759 RepID=UPI003D3589C0